MKKILILNLTRIGDLIQTTPLTAGLKEADPDTSITMLAHTNFAGICKHLPNIDRLLLFNVKQLEQGNKVAILDVYRYIENLVKELKAEKFDMLVNLSHSPMTMVFAKMLGIPDVRGGCASDDGYRVTNDPWFVYFTGMIDFRLYNRLNLVDIYQIGGGVKPAARGLLVESEGPAEAVKPLLKELGIEEGDAVIGVQAGASLKERRWPPEKFAVSADEISKRKNAKVLLFGAPSEKELGDRVASAMRQPSINLVGKTSLEELIGLVKRCDLLITNDTATMHIASAVGTPSIALFFVHAYPVETGPYGEGSITIEPDIECFPCSHGTHCPHYDCFNRVTPIDVADAAELLPELKNHNEPFVAPEKFPTARLFTPFFDEYGFWDLRPLKKQRLREHEVLGRIYRHLFLQPYMEDADSKEWIGYLKRNFELWPDEDRHGWIEKETAKFRKLAKVASDARRTLTDMQSEYKKQNVKKLQRLAKKLPELDERISTLGHAHPELQPFVRIFEMGKENIPDSALGLMFEKTRILYKSLIDATAVIIGLLKEWDEAERPAAHV